MVFPLLGVPEALLSLFQLNFFKFKRGCSFSLHRFFCWSEDFCDHLLELMYKLLFEGIKWILSHHHCFQLFVVQMSLLIEIAPFIPTNLTNLLYLSSSLDKFLNLLNFLRLKKDELLLGSHYFWQIADMFSVEVNLLFIPCLLILRYFPLHICLLFSTLILMTQEALSFLSIINMKLRNAPVTHKIV